MGVLRNAGRGLSSSLNKSYETVNSALSITRISHVTASQVLHATPEDVSIIRSHLRSWNVPDFRSRSHPLVLRALTHPSISSWAEKVLDLPRRSLGPQTLELLGDCVVGTVTAKTILHHTTETDVNLNLNPSMMVRSLVCNKGMAMTARNIGIERLLRWEKPLPPSLHRPRLNEHGIDIATGIQSNIEINALSSAYESMAAAIYLDGGFQSATQFVSYTLLKNPSLLQNVNKDSTIYEVELERELVKLFGQPVQVIKKKPGDYYQHNNNNHKNRSYKSNEIQLEIFDLMQCPSYNVSTAHALFYTAIAVRQNPIQSTTNSNNNLNEREFITLASHFSVETARVAALTQAIELLRGHQNHTSPMNYDDMDFKEETIIPREIPFNENNPSASSVSSSTARKEVDDAVAGLVQMNRQASGFKTKLDENGRWYLDSNYKHVGNVLKRAGLSSFSKVSEKTTADEIRNQLKTLREERIMREREYLDEIEDSKNNKNDINGNQRYNRHGSGGFPRRTADSFSSSIDAKLIQDHIESGLERLTNTNSFHTKHDKLLHNVVENGQDVVKCMDAQVENLIALPMRQRAQRIAALHALGHQAVRLWAAQTSMNDVGQDRQEVVPLFEAKVGKCWSMEQEMIGKDGLMCVRDGGVKKVYVAMGMCVEAVGMPTATAWLSGVEARGGNG